MEYIGTDEKGNKIEKLENIEIPKIPIDIIA